MQCYPQEAKYLLSGFGAIDGLSPNWSGFHLNSVIDSILQISEGRN